MRRAGTGRLTRLGIAAQVGFTGLLALAALLLVNYLAGRPDWRQRFDLTEKNVNTLSTAARGVLTRIEEDVTIDVFYRPVPGPLSALQASAMERIWRLMRLMEQASEHVHLRNNDVSDRVALDQRRNELRLTGFDNVLVISRGARREVLRLAGDLVEFDVGVPDPKGPQSYVPPSMRVFRAEERIVQGILGVLREGTPKVYVSGGHGERDIFEEQDPSSLGKLTAALREDGFEVEWWRWDVDGAVPDDCTVLAILGPTSPFTDEERDAVERFVDEGGRLVVAPANDVEALERSGLIDWLAGWGIEVSRGIVCVPVFSEGRVVQGRLENVAQQLGPERMAEHPITAPLREGGRFVRLSFAHRVAVRRQPTGGASLPILSSSPSSWLDLPPFDFSMSPDSEELGPHALLTVSQFETETTRGPVLALEEERRSRLVVVGSADLLCNYLLDFNVDLARNLFNWAADREYRVAISPRDPDQRRLPIARTDALARLSRVALWGLPGLCALAGIVLALLRTRGGRRRAPRPSPTA